jgi:hypothetical protein
MVESKNLAMLQKVYPEFVVTCRIDPSKPNCEVYEFYSPVLQTALRLPIGKVHDRGAVDRFEASIKKFQQKHMARKDGGFETGKTGKLNTLWY